MDDGGRVLGQLLCVPLFRVLIVFGLACRLVDLDPWILLGDEVPWVGPPGGGGQGS